MATAARKRRPMPINRDVLRWARERVRLSYEAAAAEARVKPEQIEEWEIGPKVPTVKQARKLATIYDRPFLEFFSKKRPSLREPVLVPDFRMHRDVEAPRERYELVLIQSEAEETRLNALDLFELLGEEPPRLPSSIFASLDEPAESAAARGRAVIDPTIAEQTSLRSSERDGFVKTLRSKFEANGILVIKNSILTSLSVRGICIFEPVLPVIVFSNEAPGAQAFTLAHELGHIALRQSAISGAPGSWKPSAKKTEEWCDAFASAFLVPAEALSQFFAKPSRPMSEISDESLISLARVRTQSAY